MKKAKPGDIVVVETAEEKIRGILLPSKGKATIMLKLDSGYNIGIEKKEIKNIKIEGKTKLEAFPSLDIKGKRKDLPKISFIVTGGTISSRLDYKTGAVKWLMKPEQLFFLAPKLFDIIDVKKIERPFTIASENMCAEHWKKIAKITAELLNEENKGIIITHGTDTLHYTASALSFMLKNLNKPVVLTYAQRSTDRGSTDTVLNLTCSAYAALSDIAEVMLVGHASSDDEYCFALRGTKCRKMHSSRREAFRPINELPLAKIFPDGKIEIMSENFSTRDEKKKVFADTKFDENIALVKFYPGAKPDIVDFLVKKGCKGIVVEATGLGHVATEEAKYDWLPALKKAISSGVVICFAAQTLYGRLDPYVYAPGRKLLETGIIFLEDMLPETAYVKLGFVLAHEKNPKKIRELMLKNIAGELNEKISEKSFLY